MVAGHEFSVSARRTRHYTRFARTRGNPPMVASAPTCEMEAAKLEFGQLETAARDVVALTGRQKTALMLEKAGYTHQKIAQILGIRHRQAASRLIARAHEAERQLHAALTSFLHN